MKELPILTRGAVITCTLVVAVALSTAAMAQPGPMKVGEEERISIATPSPYPVAFGNAAREWTVHYPDATYIRVHFDRFDLAPGDFVTISNIWGTETYTYTGRGPHGNGQFWAFSIIGDTAVIRLQSTVGGGAGFTIDTFGRGTVPIFGDPNDPSVPIDPGDPGAEPESVCGTNDWLDVACYETSYPDEYGRARGAVKALIGSTSACTAFKVSDSGQFMTNNHCTASASGVQSTELRFEYQNAACGGGGSSYSGAVMGQTLVRTDYTLDYTLMTTQGNSGSIPCLEIDDRLIPAGERLYIAHHPSGGVKKLSIVSTHASNPTGLCEADASPYSGRAANTDVGYYCDTTNGSSGSPVLSGNTHKVVAIHHFGGCLNSGVRMDLIMDQIRNDLDTCAGGGGGECGDGTCDPGENECNCALDCGSPEPDEFGMCTDGVDNDCDGDIDGADTDCQICEPSGAACDTNGECCSNKCIGSRKKGKRCR